MSNADKKVTVGNIAAFYQQLKAKFMPNYTMKELREALGLGDSTVPESSGGTGGKRLYNAAQIEFMRREKTVTVTQNTDLREVFTENSMNNAWMLYKNGRFCTVAQTGWSVTAGSSNNGSVRITVTGHVLDENYVHTSTSATITACSGVMTTSSAAFTNCTIFKEDKTNDDLSWLMLWNSSTGYSAMKLFGMIRVTMTEEGVLTLENLGSALNDQCYSTGSGHASPGLLSNDGCWYNMFRIVHYGDTWYAMGAKNTPEGVMSFGTTRAEIGSAANYYYLGGAETGDSVEFYGYAVAGIVLNKSTLATVKTSGLPTWPTSDGFWYYTSKTHEDKISGGQVVRTHYSERGTASTQEPLSPVMFSPIGDTVSTSGVYPVVMDDIAEDAKFLVTHSSVLVFDSDGVTAVVGSLSLATDTYMASTSSTYQDQNFTRFYYVPNFGFKKVSDSRYEAFILVYNGNTFCTLYTYTVTIS